MRCRVHVDIRPGNDWGSPTWLPEISWVGLGVWTRNAPQGDLGVHSHDEVWEICYLVRGLLDYELDGQQVVLRAGDCIVLPPGQPHPGVNRVLHRCELCYLALRLPPAQELPGLPAAESERLARGYRRLRGVRRPDPAVMLPAFALLRAGPAARHLQPVQRAALHQVVFAVLDAARAPSLRPVGPEVRRAQSLLAERLAAPVRMEELAAAAGLSRSALHARFVEETGYAPREYLDRLRIERAKALLVGGASNAEVARTLGFASPQHLATAFKRGTGHTPRQWLRLAHATAQAQG